MEIKNNILKHYLKNCYFITGTAYAGKSMMCKMLAEKYRMIHCEENYNMDVILSVVNQQDQPNLNYFHNMSSWQEYVSRTPEEFENWYDGVAKEVTGFEIAELIRLSANQKVIVDTNIPCEVLWQISDYKHVVVMLSSQSMSVNHFFDRSDQEKNFLLSEILKCPDSESVLQNFKNCIARVNSQERYHAFANSGFFTIVREDVVKDTREEKLKIVAKHFELDKGLEVLRLNKGDVYWHKLIDFTKKCSWIAGLHIAEVMERNAFTDWESIFAAILDGRIVGYCTIMKTDYYPDNKYSPWISSIFVDEEHKGNRISEKMINTAIAYAKLQGFSKVYIPSDMIGFYEKFGFHKIDELQNYSGDIDNIFMKEI